MTIAPVLLLLAAQQPTSPLENGGFEAPGPASGWTISPPAASIDIDTRTRREGRQSISLHAEKPATVSISQELFLLPGTLWRATAWLKQMGAVGRMPTPSLHIDTPAGEQGSETAQSATTDWQQMEVLFRVPSPGRVRLRLVAFDGTAGKVWFDNVKLDPLSEADDGVEEIAIFPAKLADRPIDLKQGGQFIEPLCRLTPSMIAQQVEATSFEEEPPWKPSYKREIDKPYRPWYPDGAVHLARYALDSERPFNGKRSQKIDLPAAHSRAGISQDGFYLERGHRYDLRLHMRGVGQLKPRAWLHSDGGVTSGPVALGTASAEWESASATFEATKNAQNATLTIDFEGPGTLWLDRIYLIDENAVLGIWRSDVVDALKTMNPGIIRFGGSTLEVFEWDKCLGNWDQRVPYATNPWGGLDPNFIGVEEFIQLCRHVRAEPLICVRWSGKKPEDAAAEVEYFNGKTESAWGRVRARNGHPEPYAVKYWQIGNEIGGPEYDASVKAFAEAMRRVDPDLKILSSFPSGETLKLGGGYLDYLCPHHYDAGDLVAEEKSFQSLEEQILRYAGTRDVRVAVTEWNTTAGQMGLTRGMLLTLGNALSCSRYQNLMHRYSSLVEIAARSNLSDSFGSGVLQPGPGWLYLSPTYYSQSIYQRAAESFPVRISRTSSLPAHLQEPDLSATLSRDEKTLRIYAVNSTSTARRVRMRLKEFSTVVAGGGVFVLGDSLQAGDSEAMNSHDDPTRVALSFNKTPIRGPAFEYRFEPFTVTLLELDLTKQ